MIQAFISKMILDRTDSGLVQFIRYGFVSVAALAVDFGGMVLLVEVFSVHYLLATTISFIFGLVVNYALSRIWVFGERTFSSRAKEFTLFAGIGLAGLALNSGIMWLTVEKIGLYYLSAKIIATILVFFWNFGLRKTLVFKEVSQEE